MKHLGAKILVLVLVLALIALESCLGLLTLRLGGLEPRSVTHQSDAVIRVGFFGIPSRAEIRVNDRLLPPRILWGQATIESGRPAQLQEGPNQVRIKLFPLIPVRFVEKVWTVRLDSEAPSLTLSTPSIVPEAALHLTGQTEPGARLVVRLGEQEVGAVVDEQGNFVADLQLKDGINALVLTAADLAGNQTVLEKSLICDQHPPLAGAVTPAPSAVIGKNGGLLFVSASDPDSGLESVRVTLDGQELERRPASDASGNLAFATGLMSEGRREVVLTARDKAGWSAEQKWWFIVDSTEALGLHTLTVGARGADVKQLQKKLVARGLLHKEEITGLFDQATCEAVSAFQHEQGLEPDGKVGAATLAELGPRIVVYLNDFVLELTENGRKIKSYPIAHGQAAYPTPKGEFHVADMVVDPTWLPPDSAWAREAQPIAPGPNNPLGTRWIGLNSGVVGIHGTNDAGSIGSRASHGCIRMYVEDVEELYSRIQLGTPVSIR